MNLIRRIIFVLVAAAIFSAPLTVTGCRYDHDHGGWHHDHYHEDFHHGR